MAASALNWEAGVTSLTSALTTELNGLATDTMSVASSAINNTSTLDTDLFLELNLGTAQSAYTGGQIDIYAAWSYDGGTTYPTAPTTGGNSEDAENLIASIAMPSSGTTARVMTVGPLPAMPGYFKLYLDNRSGGQFAATGNTLKYAFASLENQ